MSTVLFAPETFNLAETTRAIEVARKLRDRHECVFAGYSARYVNLVEEAGFELHRLQPELDDEQADQLIRFDQGKSVSHPFDVKMLRARVRSELDLIERVRPAAVVIGTTLSQFVSARAAKVPLVYVKPFAYSWPHVRQTRSVPLFSGDGSFAGTVNRGAATLLRGVAGWTTYKPGSFRTVAREYGVELPRRTIEALDADLNLVASHSPYLRSYRLPEHYRLVGPVFARLPGEVPAEVVAIAEEAVKRDRPVVYMVMGSSGNRETILKVLRELSRMPVTVIAPVAHFLTDRDRRDLGAHVHVRGLLPAHLLGPLVDAAVIHGGEGTVQTAVLWGKPFVGIGFQLEQRWNIADCVEFGNAIGLAPAQAAGEPLRDALTRVLHDPLMRTRAKKMADRFASVDGAAAAAEHIDGLITQG